MDVKTNVVLNSTGMVIYTSTPHRISTTNATALNPRYTYMGFTFTGNASMPLHLQAFVEAAHNNSQENKEFGDVNEIHHTGGIEVHTTRAYRPVF